MKKYKFLAYTIIILFAARFAAAAGESDEIYRDLQNQVAQCATLKSKIEYLSSVLLETNRLTNASNIRKTSAITLLGGIGGTNAISIGILISNINFIDKRSGNSPASQQLVNIGEPSVSALLKIFQNTSDKETIRWAAQTLALIKGQAYTEFVRQQRDNLPRAAWEKLTNAPVITIVH